MLRKVKFMTTPYLVRNILQYSDGTETIINHKLHPMSEENVDVNAEEAVEETPVVSPEEVTPEVVEETPAPEVAPEAPVSE